MPDMSKGGVVLAALLLLPAVTAAVSVDDAHSYRFNMEHTADDVTLANASLDTVQVQADAPAPSAGYTLRLQDAAGDTLYETNFTFEVHVQGHYGGVEVHEADTTTVWTPLYTDTETVVVTDSTGQRHVSADIDDYISTADGADRTDAREDTQDAGTDTTEQDGQDDGTGLPIRPLVVGVIVLVGIVLYLSIEPE